MLRGKMFAARGKIEFLHDCIIICIIIIIKINININGAKRRPCESPNGKYNKLAMFLKNFPLRGQGRGGTLALPGPGRECDTPRQNHQNLPFPIFSI